MKAAWFNQFGSAENVMKVGEWESPMPKSNEVKVRIHTSCVNPSDTKKRAGANPSLLDPGPVIPHSDGAGIIMAVGSGVSSSRIGERVWVYNAQYGRQEGTAAEFVCLPENQAVWLPDSASFETGAMMGIPAMTAHRCVLGDGSVKDQKILITGGAGRVGFYAIQWAKHFGATVIATAASEKSAAECQKAGADLVIGHPSAKSNEELLEFTMGQKIDRVVDGDFGANLLPALDIIKTSGTIASYSSMTDMNPTIPFVRMMFMDLTLRLVLVYAMPEEAKDQAKQDITDLLTKDLLINRVAAQFPLHQTPRAHDLIEKGGIFGSVVINF
ncbi:MAG: NADPH:quinone reductase [Reichenbachiella sp.]